MEETPRNSVPLADPVKNYRSANLLEYKQSLLVLSSNATAKAREARAGWPEASDQHPGGQRPLSQRLGGQGHPVWKEGQENKSFVLRTYVVQGVGVREVHFD